EGLFRIGDRLALGRLADEALAVVREGDDGRRSPHAFRIFDDFRRLAFHHGDARIGRAEVDTDDLAHCLPSLCSRSDGPSRHPQRAPARSSNPDGSPRTDPFRTNTLPPPSAG